MEQIHFFSTPLESNKELYYKNFVLHLVRNPRQKTLCLNITKNGHVRVSCNKSASIKKICAFIDKHQNWIEKQLLHQLKLRKSSPGKHLLTGELFPFCGEQKTLHIIRNTNRTFITLQGRQIYAGWPHHVKSTDIFQALQQFYKQQGKKILKQKIQFYSKQMNMYPSKISFRAQKSLFGSCSEDGHISLNWTLVASPHFVMNYIVIHELAHLKHLRHSQSCWKYVKQYDPDYPKAEKWLKNKGHQIDFLTEVY